jgi:hypothetical protein
MVRGYIPENSKKVEPTQVISESPKINLSKPQITLQVVDRPVRTGGCSGCGTHI